MLSVVNARIDVFKPGNNSWDSPDLVVPDDDIGGVELTERINRRKDDGSVTIHNDHGEYSSASEVEITPGDRLVFYVEVDIDIDAWGDGVWGEGGWGGEHLRWTALVRDREFKRHSANHSQLVLACEDFVFGVLAMRNVYNVWENERIDTILDTIIPREAPEVNRRATDLPTTTTINADGTDLLELVATLQRRANAYAYADRNDLVVKPVADLSPAFTVQGDDIGLLSAREFDAGVVNRVRVDGGEARAKDDTQTTQGGYVTVTQSSREQFRVDTRKSAIDRLELWTRTTGAEESITVRVQKDIGDGSGPVAPDDSTSDIASKTLSHEFLASDGYTTFLFGNHTLPEPRPWILVETDGDTGQDIGTDGATTPTPTYKSWYRYNVTVQKSNRQSQNAYRLREERIKAQSIESIDGALEVADEKLNHDAHPDHDVEAPADSVRTHELQVGDCVRMDFPRENTVGEYIITERSDSYTGTVLDTSLKAQEISTL